MCACWKSAKVPKFSLRVKGILRHRKVRSIIHSKDFSSPHRVSPPHPPRPLSGIVVVDPPTTPSASSGGHSEGPCREPFDSRNEGSARSGNPCLRRIIGLFRKWGFFQGLRSTFRDFGLPSSRGGVWPPAELHTEALPRKCAHAGKVPKYQNFPRLRRAGPES